MYCTYIRECNQVCVFYHEFGEIKLFIHIFKSIKDELHSLLQATRSSHSPFVLLIYLQLGITGTHDVIHASTVTEHWTA